jgi:hypothetical protein
MEFATEHPLQKMADGKIAVHDQYVEDFIAGHGKADSAARKGRSGLGVIIDDIMIFSGLPTPLSDGD